MKTIVYVSTATVRFDEAALEDLLAIARRNNAARDVTGMLVHCSGNFLQVLEGPDAAVDAVFDIIMRDPRHDGVRVLLSRDLGGRQFPDWAMAFTRSRDRKRFDGAVDMFGEAGEVAAHLSSANSLRNLILGFVERNHRAFGLTGAA